MIRFEILPGMPRFFSITLTTLLVALGVSLGAQQPTPGAQAPLADSATAQRHEIASEKNHHYIGKVEFELGDTKIYADEAWLYSDENRFVATGNVVFSQGANRIASDKADFNTTTHLGTFYNATGIATVQPPRQPVRPGAVAVPQRAGEETNVYFFGDTVEKLGAKKYKITNGGFTTCVQPTPRWDLHADTIVLNVGHYTLMRQAVLKVKGVPMLYVPILYYPTKKEDRATGILIPTYGSSTLRGQSIHNAFFWAIDRSQDATLAYDWFSKVGQGAGGEYRYNFGGGSDGNIRAYFLDQHESSYAQPDGTSTTLAASRSFNIDGSASQMLPGNLRARARVSYFSSLETSQTFNTNIYDASRNQRTFGGNLVGVWGLYSLNGTFDHSEYFYGTDSSSVSGSWPRFAFARSERAIEGTPLYFSVGSEFAHILRENRSPGSVDDQTMTRVDFNPQIRFPFKHWQFFTINSTLAWRDTFYTRSVDANGSTVDDALNRRFFTMQAQILGPVFNRIWDTPQNGYAEKFKHSIEPYLNVTRTSTIDNYNRILRLEGTDYIVGGATQYAYGLTNRFYAKRRLAPGQVSQAREILDVELTQTYYTDQVAAQYDSSYATSFTGAAPSNFSPYALNIRLMPTTEINASVRAEFDNKYHALRTISANGSYAWTGRVQSTVGWSKRAFIKDLEGFNDPNYLDHYINTSTSVHTIDNRVGGVYAFNYDVLRSTMLQQRTSLFYNTQCCGIAFEYQTYHLAGISATAVPADHRFFLSFTLAGLGNFSPFNGALSGVPR
jgi:LPS-assembly protein